MTAIQYSNFPDARGHFGVHGGRFVSETLMSALLDLEKLYNNLKDDPTFRFLSNRQNEFVRTYK